MCEQIKVKLLHWAMSTLWSTSKVQTVLGGTSTTVLRTTCQATSFPSLPISIHTWSYLANPIWHCTIIGTEIIQADASSFTSSRRPLLRCLIRPVTACAAPALLCIASIITQRHTWRTTFPGHMSTLCTGKWHNKTTWRHMWPAPKM